MGTPLQDWSEMWKGITGLKAKLEWKNKYSQKDKVETKILKSSMQMLRNGEHFIETGQGGPLTGYVYKLNNLQNKIVIKGFNILDDFILIDILMDNILVCRSTVHAKYADVNLITNDAWVNVVCNFNNN